VFVDVIDDFLHGSSTSFVLLLLLGLGRLSTVHFLSASLYKIIGKSYAMQYILPQFCKFFLHVVKGLLHLFLGFDFFGFVRSQCLNCIIQFVFFFSVVASDFSNF
jgi:hypothetical protein